MDHIDTPDTIKGPAIDNSGIPAGSTCRFCRSDATVDNPLFHPCKCKGSIKYIHESCLMEWIASKNVDLSRSDSSINCDICHHSIQFRTMYAENMPDSIPLILLIKKTIMSIFNKTRIAFTLTLASVIFGVFLPLTWDYLGKLYMFMLDRELPFHDEFLKSMLYGYQDNVPSELTNSHIIIRSLLNIKSSIIQIALIIILHIALYFQYDMIVRESVFGKMVFHKIGPQYSKEELIKTQLKERFPMMDDETLEHVARLMKTRNQRVEQGNAAAAAAVAEEQRHDDNVPVNQNNQFNNEVEDDDDLDPDYIQSDNESLSQDELSSEDDNEQSSEEVEDNNNDLEELEDLLMDHDEPLHDQFVNRRAQDHFDNLLDQHINGFQEPHNEPEVQPFNQAPGAIPAQAALFGGPPPQIQQPVAIDIGNEDQQAAGPLVINLKMKLSNVLIYYCIGVLGISIYLSVSYFIPTIIGFGLLKLYLGIIRLCYFSIIYGYFLSNFSDFYNSRLIDVPYISQFNLWVMNNVINNIARYYDAYINNTMRSSLFLRVIPSLATYLTAIFLVCVSSDLIAIGFNRKNGMKNQTRRLIFQILFAIKCTFKVFTLFFIELLGFPIFAGLMLDFSFFCFIFGANDKFLVMFEMCKIWPFLTFIIYWGVGTMYMYWFAKYIGMVREHIIRPGVLFFIRSPDDPNIKILHDSLIHPMGIQLSRLCLSIFIYAVFIIVGFGFHVRILFPIIVKSSFVFLSGFSSIEYPMFHVAFLIFYLAKNSIEARQGVKYYVRKYWEIVFAISSSKLRLSSFILGKDIPTERGHIVYRNIYFRVFASKKAQWSNPDLFTNPKASDQVTTSFQENRTIHAYFVPDGVLMRVPSSDIISRNYVQTLFVPVTKSDKILKPLDLKRIIERNKKNAGEFGYLDEQSTEFDGYSIVYAPPNFRLRYFALIGFVWLFASLLFITAAIVSQYLSNTLLYFTSIPLLMIFTGVDHPLYIRTIKFISLGYRQLSIPLLCLGAIALAFLLNKYYEYDLHHRKLREHIVPVFDDNGEVQPAANANIAQDQVDEFGIGFIIGNFFREFILTKIFIVLFLIFFTFVRNHAIVFNMLQIFVFGVGFFSNDHFVPMQELFSNYWPRPFSSGVPSTISHWCLEIFLFTNNFPLSRKLFLLCSRNDFLVNRVTIKSILTIMKVYVRFTYTTTLPIILIWIISATAEYYLHKEHYSSYFATFVFLWSQRLLPENANIEWTLPQYMCYLSVMTVMGLHILVQFVSMIKRWLFIASQNVKDEVYARGRALENFSAK